MKGTSQSSKTISNSLRIRHWIRSRFNPIHHVEVIPVIIRNSLQLHSVCYLGDVIPSIVRTICQKCQIVCIPINASNCWESHLFIYFPKEYWSGSEFIYSLCFVLGEWKLEIKETKNAAACECILSIDAKVQSGYFAGLFLIKLKQSGGPSLKYFTHSNSDTNNNSLPTYRRRRKAVVDYYYFFIPNTVTSIIHFLVLKITRIFVIQNWISANWW